MSVVAVSLKKTVSDITPRKPAATQDQLTAQPSNRLAFMVLLLRIDSPQRALTRRHRGAAREGVLRRALNGGRYLSLDRLNAGGPPALPPPGRPPPPQPGPAP